MEKLLKEALEHYEFESPKIIFLRHNENITYKIEDKEKEYVLRIHKPVEGYSLGIFLDDMKKHEYIQSEMILLKRLHLCKSLTLQSPVLNKEKALITILEDKTAVTVLEWVQGVTLSDIKITDEIAKKIGTMIANFHSVSKKFELNNNFFYEGIPYKLKRYKYTQQIIEKIRGEFEIARAKKQIDGKYIDITLRALEVINKRMDELSVMHGMMGFVHADLSPSNMILTSEGIVAPIDFSLSGIGFYYMDIGMILSSFNDKNIRRTIKNEYEKIINEEIHICYIEAFFALGVILFISCQHDKIFLEDWFNSAMKR